MKFSNFIYLCKEGGRNILKNKLMSFASIGVLVACMLLIGSAMLFSLNINSVVKYVEQQNEIVVFLSPNLAKQDVEVVGLSLKNMENILDTKFISKEEALSDQKAKLSEEYVSLLDGLDSDNPLLDSFVVRIKDLGRMEGTVADLRAMDGIVRVNAATDVANILTGLKKTVNVAGAGVVAILLVVSVVIIVNTIKITVFSRRKEINIMKYVGATDTFIRLPFLVEGMLIGLLAAIIAFLVLGFGYTYLVDWIGANYIDQIAIVYNNAIDFWDYAPYIFAGFAGMGIFLGTIGSGVFVRRYLKV